MLRLIRFLPGAVLGWLIPGTVVAQNPATAGNAPSVTAEVQAELDAASASTWRPTGSLRGSIGWRDNVLLSPFAPIERLFGRGEIEAMLFVPVRDHWEFISFLTGDVLRYFSAPPETGGEQQWAIHAEGRWQPVAPLRLSLKAVGYLHDMVIDLSETEVRRVVAPTRVRGGYVTAVPRLTLPAHFRFEPMVQVRRTDYRDYAGDYDEVKGGGRLEWRRFAAVVPSASWSEVRRRYDQRTQFTAGGRPRPGTQLRFRQRDADLRVRTAWKAGGDWSLALTAGRMENRDEASGYFDYDQKRGRIEFGWQRAAWRVNLDVDGRRLDYLAQTVGAGIAPPPRIAEDFETNLRVEREVNERWAVFVEHRWERSRSNEAEFSYRANTMLAGIQRSF